MARTETSAEVEATAKLQPFWDASLTSLLTPDLAGTAPCFTIST